jgi:hypothetical protein
MHDPLLTSRRVDYAHQNVGGLARLDDRHHPIRFYVGPLFVAKRATAGIGTATRKCAPPPTAIGPARGEIREQLTAGWAEMFGSPNDFEKPADGKRPSSTAFQCNEHLKMGESVFAKHCAHL